MRVLRVLLYVVLALVLVVVLLGLFGPKEFHVERSVVIDAPPAVVFPYVTHFEKTNTWGPWLEEDPEAEVRTDGEDGTEGASSYWNGNDKVGEGTQTLTTVAADTFVESHLHFIRPWESESDASFHLRPADGGTEVTWSIYGDNNFVARIMSTFSDLDKYIGPSFEKGLNNLKELVEGDLNKEYKGYKIKLEQFPGRKMIAARSTVSWADMEAYFSEKLPAIFIVLNQSGLEMDGMPCGLYYTWDEKNQSTDMAAAIGYKGEIGQTKFKDVELPAGSALVIDYYGPYDKLGDAHEALEEFMNTTNVNIQAPVVEEYITDPSTEPENPDKWLTKIYYFL